MRTEITTPTTPNFLQVRIGNSKELVTVAVKDLSEEELKEVGKKWTEDLLAKAKRYY